MGSGRTNQTLPFFPRDPAPDAALTNKTATAAYGKALALVYGTFRIGGNVILSGSYLTTYAGRTMTAGIAQTAICEGPVTDIVAIWKEKTKYTLAGLSGTLSTGVGVTAWSAATTYAKGDWASSGGTNYDSKQAGNLNHAPPNATWWEVRGSATTERAQSPWATLVTSYPLFALGYGGTAIVSVSGLGTNAMGALDRCSFEVSGLFCIGSGADAEPTIIIVDLLTNAEYGLGWPSSRVADFSTPTVGGHAGFLTGMDGTDRTSYYNACHSTPMTLSLAVETRRPAREIIEEIATATNAVPLWSSGVLKMVPLETTYKEFDAVSIYDGQNTVVPTYDLGASAAGADFLADEGEDRIEVEREPLKEHYNCHPVEWSNRTPTRTDVAGTAISEPFNSYNADIEEGTPDPSDVLLYGLRRAPVTTLRCITSQAHAAYISDALTKQSIGARNVYRFRLGWRFALLEPADLVTLTDATLGLSRRLVRVREVEEDDAGNFNVTAEEVATISTAPAATYTLT